MQTLIATETTLQSLILWIKHFMTFSFYSQRTLRLPHFALDPYNSSVNQHRLTSTPKELTSPGVICTKLSSQKRHFSQTSPLRFVISNQGVSYTSKFLGEVTLKDFLHFDFETKISNVIAAKSKIDIFYPLKNVEQTLTVYYTNYQANFNPGWYIGEGT